jgi:3-oxoacyl-[acyl-carrier-protein] synthase II
MRDVVVTGIGIASALGHTPDEYWTRLRAGEVAVRVATPAELGVDAPVLWAPIDDFDPAARFDPRIVAGTDRCAQLLMAAAIDAVADAGLDAAGQLHPRRTAVMTGTSMGGLNSVIDAQSALERDGVDAIPRKVQIMMWPNMGAAQLAHRWKLHGPQLTICTACASSADAIGIAARHIETGMVDVAIVGGSDAQLRPLVLLSAGGLGAGSSALDPLRASLPFDVNRSGMVVGEGGGAVVLESRAHAAARGAVPLAAIAGYGSLADSYHPSSPDPSGEWQALTMRTALDDAGLEPDAISAVVAHGTATRVGDISEIRALNRYLGRHAGDVKVASVKGHVGHASGGAAAMSVVAAIGALRDGLLPMNAGTTEPEGEADFEIVVGGPATIAPGAVQVNAFGFGGQNASLVLTPA